MAKKNVISVIVPVYNVEKYLPQCLISLAGQTYKNLEIIIVDDGSPDNSVKIAAEFAKKDKRIKIIRQKNAGISGARNTGIDAATGDWVHFFDPDDYIPIDYYDRMIEAVELHPEIDMTVGGVHTIAGNLSFSYDRFTLLSTMFAKFYETKCLTYGQVWRYLFRREFLIKNKFKFDTSRKFFEDEAFMINPVKHARVIATAVGADYNYVIRPGSAIMIADKKRFEDRRWAKKLIKDFVADNALPAWLLDKYTVRANIKLFNLISVFKIAYNLHESITKYYLFGIPIFRKRMYWL